MHYDISKEFEFDYGHRVWSQVLDKELSCSAPCACRHLHGHRGKVIVHLMADELNDQGMVVDFVNLNWLKKFIDDTIDHKMVLDINDPLLEKLLSDYVIDNGISCELDSKLFILNDFGNYYTLKIPKNIPDELKEFYEGIILVKYVPTSENLSKWFFDVITLKMKSICEVSHVEFYETPKSKSVYYG